MLALLAAAGGHAWATRLDKASCADLTTELASLMGGGLKEDMDKGPAWAAGNLPPERIASINRAIDLQGLIEFRCNAPPGHNAAKSHPAKPDDKAPADKPGTAKATTAKANGEEAAEDAAAATKPAQKARTMRHKRGSAATSPEMPAVVPAATTPPLTPGKAAPEVQKAVVTTPPPATPAVRATAAKPAPELSKTAMAAPATVAPPSSRVMPVSTTQQAAVEMKKAVPIAPITAPTPAPGQAAATVPGSQKTAAAKKPSRRDSTGAYVSPKDVNPFSLVTGN